MSIKVDYQPTEYKALFWRSIVNSWVRTDWYDTIKRQSTWE